MSTQWMSRGQACKNEQDEGPPNPASNLRSVPLNRDAVMVLGESHLSVGQSVRLGKEVAHQFVVIAHDLICEQGKTGKVGNAALRSLLNLPWQEPPRRFWTLLRPARHCLPRVHNSLCSEQAESITSCTGTTLHSMHVQESSLVTSPVASSIRDL
jgi:hypothetical protein